jgi:hypothetical protein
MHTADKHGVGIVIRRRHNLVEQRKVATQLCQSCLSFLKRKVYASQQKGKYGGH